MLAPAACSPWRRRPHARAEGGHTLPQSSGYMPVYSDTADRQPYFHFLDQCTVTPHCHEMSPVPFF